MTPKRMIALSADDAGRLLEDVTSIVVEGRAKIERLRAIEANAKEEATQLERTVAKWERVGEAISKSREIGAMTVRQAGKRGGKA